MNEPPYIFPDDSSESTGEIVGERSREGVPISHRTAFDLTEDSTPPFFFIALSRPGAQLKKGLSCHRYVQELLTNHVMQPPAPEVFTSDQLTHPLIHAQ